GANIIIVAVHAGLDEPASYDTVATALPSENVSARLAREIPGIDLIVYGHSHREQPNLHIGPTLLVQPKNWATSLGVAHLTVARIGGSWKVSASRGETLQASRYPESPAVLVVSAPTHVATRAYANEVIGTTAVAWRGDSARLKDTPLIDLITEVERKATGADLASTAAFTLDAALAAGPITVAKIAQLYPYDNTLRAIRITGKQLRDYLEFSARYYASVQNGTPVPDPQIPGYNFDIVSGVDYVIDLTKPIGARITSLAFKGKPVTDTDSFTLALNNYRQSGGGGYSMIKSAPVVYDKQQEIRQLLIDEVQSRKTIRPDDFFKQNWTLVYSGGPSQKPGSAGIPPGTPRLRIISTNDFHGGLEPRIDAEGRKWGGAAYTATVIEKARSECVEMCVSILVDAGDEFQGTPVSNLSYGRPVVDYYNRMGYTAAAVGNHEFDWGVDTLRARMRDAKYALLAANVRTTDGKDVSWIRDDTIVVRGKTRVGLIGIATTETATSTLPANVKGLRFDDPAAVIDERAKSLRSRGADVVIALVHEGGFCNTEAGSASCTGRIFDIASRITERVDGIVSGHSHSFVDTYVKGIPIVQARYSGQAVAVLDIPLNADGKPSGGEAVGEVRPVPVPATPAYAPVDSIVRRASARIAAIVNKRYSTVAVAMNRDGTQYALGNLITDSQRWAAKGDIAIMNNRGIRAGLRAGDVTYGTLFEIEPFANSLYSIRMTGAQVGEYFEKLLGGNEIPVHVSGITIGFNPDKPKGERIVSLRLPAGRTLIDDAIYSVIVNNFMGTGGSNLGPPEGVQITPLDINDLDALIGYVKTLKSPITPPSESRIFIAQ
ncbi:MAG: 5'-nucleotidase C-terminal domain-containing protein, partial [Gemmatimonadales bacterium]